MGDDWVKAKLVELTSAGVPLIGNINRTATIPLANVSSHIRPISTNGAADNPEFETSVDTPLGKCRGTLPADAGPEDDLASRVRRLFSTSEALLCSVCYEPYDCTTSGPRAPITVGCCSQHAKTAPSIFVWQSRRTPLKS